MLIVMGAITSAAGVLLLYFAWRKTGFGGRWPVLTGWFLLLISSFIWSAASGAEFGITYALAALSLFAWILIGRDVQWRRPKVDRKTRVPPALPTLPQAARHFGIFICSVPLAGAAAMLVSAAFPRILPWHPVNAMVFGVLLMPVLWGAAAYWACADSRPLRPTLTLLACAGVSAMVLFL